MIDGKKFLNDEEINVFPPTSLLELSDDAATLHLRDGQDDADIFRFFHIRKRNAWKAADRLPLLARIVVQKGNKVELASHNLCELTTIIARSKKIKFLLFADVLIDMIEFMPGMVPFHVIPLLPDAGFPHIPGYAQDSCHSFLDRFALRAA